MDNRKRLREIVKVIVDSGVLTDSIKALSRDRREPERRAKVALELRLRRLILRYFMNQRRRVLARVEMYTPARKSFDVSAWLDALFGPGDPVTEKLTADVMRLVLTGTQAGVELFRRNTSLEMDYTLVNANASAAVNEYVGNLITSIDKTTLDATRQAVQQFVDTPGMTMGDLQGMLPFDVRRANSVAVTEVTRAYGEGERVAGEAMRDQYPDVKIVKKWYTNEDDKVCPLCGPLGDADKWIPIDQAFDADPKTGEAIMNPPRHVNCRCWMSTRTDING